jgi:hypothetical protein
MPITFPRPDPCPVCGGTVTYSGRGRRPVYDRPECRRADRTEYQRDRDQRVRATHDVDPAVAAAREARAARVAGRPYTPVRREKGDWMPEAEALDGVASWTDSHQVDADGAESYLRKAVPRGEDPAARWVAENHPEELASFPRGVRVGSTR